MRKRATDKQKTNKDGVAPADCSVIDISGVALRLQKCYVPGTLQAVWIRKDQHKSTTTTTHAERNDVSGKAGRRGVYIKCPDNNPRNPCYPRWYLRLSRRYIGELCRIL